MGMANWITAAIIVVMPVTVHADEISLDRTCKEGNLNDCIRLGLDYEFQRLHESDKTKYPEMFRKAEFYYLKACKSGLSLGCHLTANLYMVAEVMGLPSHDDLVAKFDEMACDGDNADGCASLALHESFGTFGATKNPDLALQHVAKAARIRKNECDTGNLRACLDLGYQYETASGVDCDTSRALVLYKKACAGAVRFACDALERLTRELGK